MAFHDLGLRRASRERRQVSHFIEALQAELPDDEITVAEFYSDAEFSLRAYEHLGDEWREVLDRWTI